jgi:hypothetical protein
MVWNLRYEGLKILRTFLNSLQRKPPPPAVKRPMTVKTPAHMSPTTGRPAIIHAVAVHVAFEKKQMFETRISHFSLKV